MKNRVLDEHRKDLNCVVGVHEWEKSRPTGLCRNCPEAWGYSGKLCLAVVIVSW